MDRLERAWRVTLRLRGRVFGTEPVAPDLFWAAWSGRHGVGSVLPDVNVRITTFRVDEFGLWIPGFTAKGILESAAKSGGILKADLARIRDALRRETKVLPYRLRLLRAVNDTGAFVELREPDAFEARKLNLLTSAGARDMQILRSFVDRATLRFTLTTTAPEIVNEDLLTTLGAFGEVDVQPAVGRHVAGTAA